MNSKPRHGASVDGEFSTARPPCDRSRKGLDINTCSLKQEVLQNEQGIYNQCSGCNAIGLSEGFAQISQ